MRLTFVMTSAALIALTATTLPAATHAGGLLDVSATLGGGSLASANVNANVGGIGADVDARLGTTTGTVVGSTVKASLAAPTSLTGVAARADIAKTLHAKARVLGPKQLLALCIRVGAKGCDAATRQRQLALIDARAAALSGQQLANACVSVGGACGGASPGAIAPPAAGSGSASSAASGRKDITLASASDSDRDRAMRLSCRSVLANPARYEAGLAMLCRKIGQ